MDEGNLINEIREKSRLLDVAIKELRNRGKSFAQAEQDYRVGLAKKILAEREKGTPVSIISDICKGDGEISMLRFKRDVAEVSYKAAIEAINGYKLQIRIIDAQIEREWGHTSHD